MFKPQFHLSDKLTPYAILYWAMFISNYWIDKPGKQLGSFSFAADSNLWDNLEIKLEYHVYMLELKHSSANQTANFALVIG